MPRRVPPPPLPARAPESLEGYTPRTPPPEPRRTPGRLKQNAPRCPERRLEEALCTTPLGGYRQGSRRRPAIARFEQAAGRAEGAGWKPAVQNSNVRQRRAPERRDLDDAFRPILEDGFYFVQELVSDGAIDHAVIVAEREIDHGADGDSVVDDHCAFLDGA